MLNYGTIVQSTVRPPSSDDNFPVAYNEELLGGLKIVATYTDLASIPIERLNVSTLAFVRNLNTFYSPTIVGSTVVWNSRSFSTIVPVTYAELLTKITEGTLSTTTTYLLTDYKTTYFYDYTVPSNESSTIYEAATEELLLTATSNTTLHHVVISPTNPTDIIYYDYHPYNVHGDMAFSYFEEVYVTIPTFKGLIYYRKDTVKNLSAYFDFRGVLNLRYNFSVPAFNAGTSYSSSDFVSYSGYIYKSNKDSNVGNTPSLSSHYWVRLINTSISNQAPLKSVFEGISVDSTPVEYTTFNNECANVHLGKKVIEYNNKSTILPNIVFLGKAVSVTLDGGQVSNVGVAGETNFGNITFGANCENNTIGQNCRNIVVGADFKNNTIGIEFRNNIIGANCRYNIINYGFNVNYIGENFRYNHILNYFNSNTIGYTFYYNTTNYFFRFNNIGANCQYNSFLQLFAYNKVLVNFKNNSTLISVQNKDFSSNVIVPVSTYSKLLLTGEDGTVKILTITSTNQINITNG